MHLNKNKNLKFKINKKKIHLNLTSTNLYLFVSSHLSPSEKNKDECERSVFGCRGLFDGLEFIHFI